MQGNQDKTELELTPQDVETHWFETFAGLLEQNIRGVQLGIYAVAFCGLGIALRSVRPFKKFATPKQIPNSFFESNIKLNGKVLDIDVTSKPFLLVDHYPALGSKLRSVGPLLPVEMEGINISPNGVCWLQTIVKGENVEFTVLKRNPSSVSSIVLMKNRNIANHLVSLGFASVAPFNLELNSLEIFTKYYAELLKAEERAEKKGTGMWFTANKKNNMFDFLRKSLPLLRASLNRVQLLKLKTS